MSSFTQLTLLLLLVCGLVVGQTVIYVEDYAGTTTPSLKPAHAPYVKLKNVTGLAVNNQEDVYFSYYEDHVIRKVFAATNTSVIVAGTGTKAFGSGPALSSPLTNPTIMTIDPDSDDILYFADQNNLVIRKLANSQLSTLVGSGNECDPNNSPSFTMNSDLCSIKDMVLDGIYLYVTTNNELNGHVLKINTQNSQIEVMHVSNSSLGGISVLNGIVYVVEGGALWSNTGGSFTDPQNGVQNLNEIRILNNEIYSIDGNHISTIYSNGGAKQLLVTDDLNQPKYLTFSKSGRIYLYDSGSNRIKYLDSDFIKLYTVVGDLVQGNNDPVSSATFIQISSMFMSNNDLYISDYLRIRKINTVSNTIHHIAGLSDSPNYAGDGENVASASFVSNSNIYIFDSNLYILDISNNAWIIRKIKPDNTIQQVFTKNDRIYSFVIENSNSIIYSLTDSNLVKQFPSENTIMGYLGSGPPPAGVDGVSIANQTVIKKPTELALTSDGVLYVMTSGEVYTIVNGMANTITVTSDDGSSIGENPKSLKISPTKNLIFIDEGDVKLLTSGGKLSTLAKGISATSLALDSSSIYYSTDSSLGSVSIKKLVYQCNVGFQFDVTTGKCVSYNCNGIAVNSSNVCSGRGKCISQDVCNCLNGYTGDFCQVSYCNSTRSDDQKVCNERGVCDNGTCTCNLEYYTGQFCQDVSLISTNFQNFPKSLLCESVSFNFTISSFSIKGYSNFIKVCKQNSKCSLSLQVKASTDLGGSKPFLTKYETLDVSYDGSLLSFKPVSIQMPSTNLCPVKFINVLLELDNGNYSLPLLSNIINNIYNLTSLQIDVNNPDNSLNVIDMIVKNNNLNTNQVVLVTQKMDDFLSNTLNLVKMEKISLSENTKSVAFSVLSNIYSTYTPDNVTERLITTFSELLIVSQNATQVSNVENILIVQFNSSSVNITVSSFKLDSKTSSQVASIGESINAKIDLSQLGNSSPMGLSLVSFSKNLKFDNFSSQATLMSHVTDFKFYSNNQYYKLNDLKYPITLQFPILKNFVQSNETKLSCRYWDETYLEWSSYGCEFIGIDGSSIICSCNHTTSFSTFMQFSNVTLTAAQKVQVSNLYYAQIAFGAFFFILSLVVMILLIIFRNKQPVASRMITPYMGMAALMISSVIIGIVQRSVLVDYLFASTSQLWEQGLTAANIISNVTMIIVNTLNLTAILSYLIQVVRFQILKYLYNVLGNEDFKNSNRYKYIRILSSRRLFILTVLTSLTLNLCYWTLWVILERTLVIGLESYVWIVGISYICIILFYSLIISLIAVSDFIITQIKQDNYTKERTRKQSKFHSESQMNLVSNNASNKKKINLEIPKGLKKFLVQDSPLYFRIEMLLYLLCFTFMIVQLVLGLISNSYRFSETTYNTALFYEIISFIFEVLYTFSFVLVFGGFPLLVLLKQAIQAKLNSSKADECEDEMMQLLKDRNGYEVFESFCENEFSTENLYLMDILMENTNFSKNPTETSELINMINEKFIKNGSVCEVNISSSSKKLFNEMVKLVNSKEIEMSNSISEKLSECYNELKDQIQINLSDTYSRFIFTPMYSQYSDQLKLLQKINLE